MMRRTEAERDSLRRRADEDGGRRMPPVDGNAVVHEPGERSRVFEEAAAHVLDVSAGLHRRLA